MIQTGCILPPETCAEMDLGLKKSMKSQKGHSDRFLEKPRIKTHHPVSSQILKQELLVSINWGLDK